MANHESAKKRVKRNAKRALINKARKSRVRTFIKKVEQAVTEGNIDTAQAALQQAQPEIDRGVAKGLMHKNKAARTLSRLSSAVKSLKKAS
ncbi:MAG: 30S ribosomal protein S20 [Alphaproteobacteria bacterium]|nr:30S ribosomal protein S20 [Alphaproteobacteria bacterium]